MFVLIKKDIHSTYILRTLFRYLILFFSCSKYSPKIKKEV